jgi:multicomponent Na+:H+ antiporter subunit F
MNAWLIAATVLMLSLIPYGIRCFHGDSMDRLVALEAAGVVDTLILLLLAEGFHRASFFDLALALALLSFAGGMVFARFLERWI